MKATKTNKSSFQVSGRHHLENFGNYDVWRKDISDVVMGIATPKTKFSVTKLTKRPNPAFNVVNDEKVEVSVFDTVEEARSEAQKLSDKD